MRFILLSILTVATMLLPTQSIFATDNNNNIQKQQHFQITLEGDSAKNLYNQMQEIFVSYEQDVIKSCSSSEMQFFSDGFMHCSQVRLQQDSHLCVYTYDIIFGELLVSSPPEEMLEICEDGPNPVIAGIGNIDLENTNPSIEH